MRYRLLLFLVLALTALFGLRLQAADDAKPPVFAETSSSPVLLRYQFAAGQQFDIAADILMTMKMQMGDRNIEVPTTMRMAFSCNVTGQTEAGNAAIDIACTRITMNVEGPAGAIAYDSANAEPPAMPELKALGAMVNQKMPCTVTPRGEIVDMDLNAVLEAIRKVSAAATAAEFENTMKESLQGTFIQLPEKEVAAGDIYDAGKMERQMQGVGKLVATIKYKVLAVSADRRQVLLQPIADFRPELPAGSPFRFEAITMDGWILFDRTRGNIDRSYATMAMKMNATEAGQTMTMNMDMVMKYATTYKE